VENNREAPMALLITALLLRAAGAGWGGQILPP